MDIPQSLYEILLAIVNIYSSEKRPVTSVEIAEYVGKSDGTVRNVISALKAMGLVEAKTGPGGGYVPTVKGVEIARGNVTFDKLWEPIKLIVNGRPTQLYVLELDFMGLGGPFSPKVVLKVVGNMNQVTRGSRVVVGPTQATRVIVRGEVAEVNSSRREILVNVESMVAVPRLKARELMTGNVLSVSPGESLRKVAEIILEKNIRALPVVDGSGKLVGIISTQHIAKAFLRGDLTVTVSEYMDRNVPTVPLEEDILDIMRLMDNRNVGRVVVVDEQGSPAGIITRTDILKAMTRMYDFFAPSRETP